MAYNPFNIFRRNQRAIFAVITVFIMFTFVLSSGLSGGADFFDWFPQWLGSKSRKGESLATIDGKTVYSRDVERVRRQRELASRFMELATGESLAGMRRTLSDLAAKASPELAIYYRLAQDPQMLVGFPGLSNQLRNNPKATAADKEAADLIDAMTALVQSGGRPFAGVPNRNSRDAIEFLLWERKAKDLGIGYTADDVKPLLDQEFRGQFRNDVPVREALRERFQGFSWDACLNALAAEFRVRTARTALLGPDLTPATLLGGRGDRTLSAHPVFAAPYEVFEFYRDKTSPTTYDVLAVPAANFAAAVPGTPSEDELRRLFEDRKDAEPDPAKEEPGFREPRKVKVEWVSAAGDEPYYRNLAKAAVSLGPVAAALTPPVAGGWPAVAIAAVGASDPVVRDLYRRDVTDRHRTMLQYRWAGGSSLYQGEVLDTSVVQPKTLVAAVGGLGQPLATASLTYTAAVAAEQRARIRAGLPLVLAGVPSPGLLPQMVGAEAMVRAALPDPLPLDAVRPELVGQMVEAKARELALADLRKLRDEVAKLTDNGKAKDKGPAKAYIAEFVKARGLTTGASADFQGEHTIGDDPGLAPLKAVLDKPSGLNPHGNLPVPFGRRFFYAERPSQPGSPPATSPATGTYQPELYPENPAGGLRATDGKADPMFLAWRTAEEPARSLAYQVARPKVVEAWKRAKARDLAKAEAERIAAEVRAMPPGTAAEVIRQRLRDTQAQLKAKAADPKAQDRVKLFPIPNVAEIQTGPDLPFSMPGAGGDIRPFGLPQTADLPYPTVDMVKGLLAERTKPAGTAQVFADRPKDTYYVAVVTDRQERGPDQFRRAMYGPGEIPGLGLGRSQVKEGLTGAFRAEAYRRAMESVMGIMKKEYGYSETDEQKKRLDEAEKRGDE
ncbi:MAG: hypothetical protein K2X82_11875 [Gemmataceae bacterium]|nr:hypothetical protein [Gemmataceae bacterium]